MNSSVDDIAGTQTRSHEPPISAGKRGWRYDSDDLLRGTSATLTLTGELGRQIYAILSDHPHGQVLIAAPDLLEVLRMYAYPGDFSGRPSAYALQATARTAIAKATESPQ